MLPAALSMGSYEIRQLNHHGPGTLFEGKVIYDKKYGSVTYGCSTCCGYTASQFQFFFDPLGIPIDGQQDQGVQGYDTCEGAWVDVTSDFYNSWSTANQSIATVDAYGVHTGVAIGSTTTRASADEQIFNERQNCPIEPVYPKGNDNVNPTVTFSPPITSVAVGQTATTTAEVNGNSNNYPISLSISGGALIVSPTGTFTSSTSVVVKGVTAGSATLTATISVQDGGGNETIGTDGFNVTPTVSISGPAYVPMRSSGSLGPNSMTLTAGGTPGGGSYSWKTTSSNVSLSNTNSASVTVTSVNASSSPQDTPIEVTYTLNGQSGTAAVSITVVEPTSLQLISDGTDPSGHTCIGGSGSNTCPSSYFQGKGTYGSYLRNRTYHILDQFQHWISGYSLVIQEFYTPPSGQCASNSVQTAGGAGDTITDCFYFCSATCQGGGSCSVSATQTVTVNGFSVDTESVTWTCSGASVVP